MTHKVLFTSLLFLLFTAIMGCLLRFYAAGIDAGLKFGNLLHAHSHTAMMGWVYVAISSLVYLLFIEKPGFKVLFGVTLASVFGLLVAFLIQGYGLFSIFFCCLHLLCTYIFVYKALSETRGETSQATRLLRLSLYLLVISTLGLLGIGPAMALADRFSGLFQTTIQFYLHFQFNGFFYFAILAIFFKSFELEIEERKFNQFVYLSALATALTFALPLSWYFPGRHLYYLQVVGSVFQLAAVVQLMYSFKSKLSLQFGNSEKALFYFSALSFLLKTLLPVFFIYPDLMRWSHEIRSVTIAFIHLMMLGMITGFLMFFMLRKQFFCSKSLSFRAGVFLFIVSFILTEGLLFVQSLQAMFSLPSWKYSFEALAIASLFFPVAIVCWLFNFKRL
jgi:hypothetical protein